MTHRSQTKPWTISQEDVPKGTESERIAHLLRYATLAPSSHNTQPWTFAVVEDEVRIFIDRSRWLQVADADQRELHISIGCALETLLVAAEHVGYAHRVSLLPDPNDEALAAIVALTPGGTPAPFRPGCLFDAITERHTNHRPFEARAIPAEELRRLETCAVEGGIALHLTDDADIKQRAVDLVVQADERQFADPAWRAELGRWIGRGVFGQPWLMAKMSQLAVTALNLGQGTAKKDSALLMSAPVLAVITAQDDGRRQQVQAGQVFQRVSLMATALGIRVHPMSQVLEFDDLRAETVALIPGASGAPQQTFRLGYAEAEGHTPRRPLAEVLA